MACMSFEEILEFEKSLRELRERSVNGAVIIVEGLRDKASLRLLGIKGKIVEASNVPSDVLAERVCEVCRESRDVIIFTDLDRSGRNLRKRVVRAFECRGIIPDVETGKKLLSLCRVSSVETLASRYYKSIEYLKF